MASIPLRADSAWSNPVTPNIRAAIEARIETLIAYLDELDGDPDLEMDDHGEDDDPPGQVDEDEWNTLPLLDQRSGPGCYLFDPGGCQIWG